MDFHDFVDESAMSVPPESRTRQLLILTVIIEVER